MRPCPVVVVEIKQLLLSILVEQPNEFSFWPFRSDNSMLETHVLCEKSINSGRIYFEKNMHGTVILWK